MVENLEDHVHGESQREEKTGNQNVVVKAQVAKSEKAREMEVVKVDVEVDLLHL